MAVEWRRCSFDKCKRPATAQGYWPAVGLTGWYCREHLHMLRRVSGVREVTAASGSAAKYAGAPSATSGEAGP